MTADPIQSVSDECYRCGYSLRGFANDHACPECGLLAERSRRISDELHETRPRWLRSISIGANLILLALGVMTITVVAFIQVLGMMRFGPVLVWLQWVPILAIYFSAAAFFLGVLLLTRRESYAPADLADRGLRRWLRIAALAPILALAAEGVYDRQQSTNWRAPRKVWIMVNGMWVVQAPHPWLHSAAFYVATLGAAPIPLLLFLRLRGLARRARSAHLAEHCVIVGIGTTVALLYLFALIEIMDHAPQWGWDQYWPTRTNVSLVLLLIMFVTVCLFILWSLYLLVRFAIAFSRATREIRRKWKRDDRSLARSS